MSPDWGKTSMGRAGGRPPRLLAGVLDAPEGGHYEDLRVVSTVVGEIGAGALMVAAASTMPASWAL